MRVQHVSTWALGDACTERPCSEAGVCHAAAALAVQQCQLAGKVGATHSICAVVNQVQLSTRCRLLKASQSACLATGIHAGEHRVHVTLGCHHTAVHHTASLQRAGTHWRAAEPAPRFFPCRDPVYALP